MELNSESLSFDSDLKIPELNDENGDFTLDKDSTTEFNGGEANLNGTNDGKSGGENKHDDSDIFVMEAECKPPAAAAQKPDDKNLPEEIVLDSSRNDDSDSDDQEEEGDEEEEDSDVMSVSSAEDSAEEEEEDDEEDVGIIEENLSNVDKKVQEVVTEATDEDLFMTVPTAPLDKVDFTVGDEVTGGAPVVMDAQPTSTEQKEPVKKKRAPNKAKTKKTKKTEDGPSETGDDVAAKPKAKRKRKRKKNEEGAEGDEKKKRKKSFERKNIRKILSDDKLTEETQKAQDEEKERQRWLQEQRERLAEQQRAEAESKKSELKMLLEAEDNLESEHKESTSALLAQAKIETKESGADDSDDSDIIILSDEPEPREPEGEDDYNNSGGHVNDDMNQPDSEGRVLVNVGHPPNEPDIFLAPQLSYTVKPHQIGGIRFIYDNLVESIERYKVSNGFGCILAHSMGLGKTLQLISFIDVFLRHTAGRTVLVIVPVNTLQNWLAEFNTWLPNGADPRVKAAPEGMVLARQFNVYSVNDNHKNMTSRAKVVADWYQNGGVLLMGYEMYRLLTSKRVMGYSRSRRSKKVEVIDLEEEDRNKELLQGMQSSLVRPGPDVVICDEGHRIKNSHASISQSLKNIRTRRRVVLTGYPLQNNLIEYWCMVDFVRPNFLGTRTEFSNMFERPIMNGQCQDSTPQDVRLMRFRAHVLHSLLEGFVQRRGHAVLRASLPDKDEHVILVKMTPIQRQLYTAFINTLKEEHLEGWVNTNPLKAFAVCCKIWNHPDVLYKIVQKKSDDNDLDLDPNEDGNGSKKKGKGKAASSNNGTLSASNSLSSMNSNSGVNANMGGLSRPGSFGALGNTDSMGSMMRSDTMGSLAPNDSIARNDSIGSLGRNDSFGSLARNDSVGIMGRSDSINSMTRTDSGLKFPNPMLPAFMNEDSNSTSEKDKQVISYEWADTLMKDYVPGLLENGGKMQILFTLIDETIRLNDKLLVFSQSLLTLNLIEELLAKRYVPGTEERWSKNKNYFRLDGSTSGQDREKLINQFNDPANYRIKLFMLSTRAGCLGVNLVGANRVVVFDASWNPCHDAQAVCRVYRYGQMKHCQIYRLVTDNTMERKIYDRQINKQGVSDRVVDEASRINMFTRKQQDTLLMYSEEEPPNINSDAAHMFDDELLQRVIRAHHDIITREPFTHESLLIDDKAGKLTRQEKRLAKQGYEMEKKMNISYTRPSYASFYPKNDPAGFPRSNISSLATSRPVASVRPMMSTPPPMNIRTVHPRAGGGASSSLPISSLLRPGVSVHQVKTTTDIVIPGTTTTTQSSGGRNKIPAGETVLVIKTPKGMYIRTNQGRIFCVRSTSAPSGGQSNEAGNLARSAPNNEPSNSHSNSPSNRGKIFAIKSKMSDGSVVRIIRPRGSGNDSNGATTTSEAVTSLGAGIGANTTTTPATSTVMSATDSGFSLNQLLEATSGPSTSGERRDDVAGAGFEPMPGSSTTAAATTTKGGLGHGPPSTAGRSRRSAAEELEAQVGSLQSLMEGSENFLGQLEGGALSGSSSHEGSPVPKARGGARREERSRNVRRHLPPQDDNDSDSDEISIVGETPGNGSSALDSLGNFSLNSLLGGAGGGPDLGRDLGRDSPVGTGSPQQRHHHQSSGGSSKRMTSSSYSAPSASFGSMQAMTTGAHHMMAPPYMPPGWGFPMWNPAGMSGMSVPMPPSGPSIQHSDRHQKPHSNNSAPNSDNLNRNNSDNRSVSDNREPGIDDSRFGETDSPAGGGAHPGSPSMSSNSALPPPFMGMPSPYGIPYSYPYSYPYMPPGMPPPPAHSSSDSGGGGGGGGSMHGFYPSMPPYPGTSYPGSGINWGDLSGSQDDKGGENR